MAGKYMLTTFDNPFNPFTDFINWYLFDNSKGYNTCGFLARVADSNVPSDEDIADSINEAAMDEIIATDPLNLYRKVSEEDYKNKPTQDLIDLRKSIEDKEKESIGT